MSVIKKIWRILPITNLTTGRENIDFATGLGEYFQEMILTGLGEYFQEMILTTYLIKKLKLIK